MTCGYILHILMNNTNCIQITYPPSILTCHEDLILGITINDMLTWDFTSALRNKIGHFKSSYLMVLALIFSYCLDKNTSLWISWCLNTSSISLSPISISASSSACTATKLYWINSKKTGMSTFSYKVKFLKKYLGSSRLLSQFSDFLSF